MNRLETRFTASLHTHVRSLYDANIDAKLLCNRIKELGGKGCAITDHGVLSSIEDYKVAFLAADLKMIPGCELYVDGGILGREHLVVLAVNDNGYHGISKIVTAANKATGGDYPVITKPELFSLIQKYKGDIIGLSACMQGVICAPFMQNTIIQKKIEKIKEKQMKYISPTDCRIEEAKTIATMAEAEYKRAIALRDETKRIAEQSFTKRKKAIEKAEESNMPNFQQLRKQLEEDMLSAERAKNTLDAIKADVEAANKKLKLAKKNVSVLTKSVNQYMSYEEPIKEIKKELLTDEDIYEQAKSEARAYYEAFGKENFYVEIQYHRIPQEVICFQNAVKIAKELGIPLVATNDVHILSNKNEERLRRQILRSLRFGKNFEEENVGDEELYLKDNYELAEILSEIFTEEVISEAIGNIDVIFNRCNVEYKVDKHYPKITHNGDANALLDEAVKNGIEWRFPNGMDEEHTERVKYELSVIKSMGYSDYHLIVKDFLEYGRLLGYIPKNKLSEAPLTIPELKAYIADNGWKNQGMLIGPGRGSAVGSLVCYLLGITNLDPIKYGLLFERFLNPERVSMPDIDSDISATTRGKVIEYVQNKYGKNAVCGIMTITTQAPKGSIKMAAKFYGLKTYGTALTTLGNTINKYIPKEVNIEFSTVLTKTGNMPDEKNVGEISLKDFLLETFKNNNDAIEIIKWATIIEGSFTAYGAHAAGIVISDNGDVSDYIPLRMNESQGILTTQCDMVQIEENGLLKFDLLGLKTLDVITETIRAIEKNYGIIIDPLTIDFADEKVYSKIFSQGRTNSVFQFESSGMKTMLKRFKPESFEDIVILVSMYRPGPIQYLDDVINVKCGKKEIQYLCPELKPILGKTYGAIVYQEQVMQIFQELAGYTLGGADQVRRYMSKKKASKLAHEKDSFINGDAERKIVGCVANGISAETARKLFEQMEDFAKYAFNKSHAAVYAFNAYITAWLKYYYPAEYISSALNWVENKKIAGLMYEAKKFDVNVLAPDVNESEKEFCVVNGSIRFGLSAVKGVKDNADNIINERGNGSYKSLSDFIFRVQPNATVINNLTSSGACDLFSKNRKAIKATADEYRKIMPEREKKYSFINAAELVLPTIEKFESEKALVQYQVDNGVKVEIKSLTTAEKLTKCIENAKKAYAVIEKEISMIKIKECPEDKTERMNNEKQFLGVYVTQHPMDFYPSAEEIGTKVISEIIDTMDHCNIYGVITNISLKNRKSDGAKMAFFELEDRSGSLEVAVFTKAYSKNKEYLVEGSVVQIEGELKIEELGDGEESIIFIANKIIPVSEKKTELIMSVSSYAVYHTQYEETFKNMYNDANGHKLIIYDMSMDEFRESKYLVSEQTKLLPNVEEKN